MLWKIIIITPAFIFPNIYPTKAAFIKVSDNDKLRKWFPPLKRQFILSIVNGAKTKDDF